MCQEYRNTVCGSKYIVHFEQHVTTILDNDNCVLPSILTLNEIETIIQCSTFYL